MRRRWGKGWRSVAATWLVLVGCAANPTQPSGGGEGILFIGNSLTYSNDLPGMLAALLQEGGGESVVVDAEASPNAGLPDHWMFGGARDRIRAGGWSVVILQQGPSATEGRPFLLDYAELFAGETRAVGAEPALYMVWPSIQRFADFDGVLDSYRTAAENVDGIFFPAGEAWCVAWESDPDLPPRPARDDSRIRRDRCGVGSAAPGGCPGGERAPRALIGAGVTGRAVTIR